MKCTFGNQYAYFSEDIDLQFIEPLLDCFYIHVFVDSDNGHDKVTGRFITGFLVVVSTSTKCSSKRQTAVQNSKFGAKFILLKKAVNKYVIIKYQLR